jgi:hypothetical protein
MTVRSSETAAVPVLDRLTADLGDVGGWEEQLMT